MHSAEISDERTAPERELVHVRLANQHSTRAFQPADHFRIFRGHAILEHAAAGGGSDTGCIEEVLHGDGNAVQRPAPFLALNFGLGVTRRVHRKLGRDGDKRVQCGVEFLNSFQGRLGDFNGRHFSLANELAQLRNTGGDLAQWRERQDRLSENFQEEQMRRPPRRRCWRGENCGERWPCSYLAALARSGGTDARYAAMSKMSSGVRSFTTGCIRPAPGPLRVKCWKPYSWRAI